jgi:predicted transcriptional regulator
MKSISLLVSDEFDHQLRVLAAQLDINRSEFIRQALEQRVARLTEDKPTALAREATSEHDVQDAEVSGPDI